jgi:hypothetical protein
MVRVKPPTCSVCGREPWICPTDGDYQCACLNPYMMRLPREKRPKIIPRVHYDKTGKPYKAQFIDFEDEDYPDDEEDIRWLIETYGEA